MDTSKYLNYLSIKQRGKVIPYGGNGIVREDGDANYGFKYLKGNELELHKVPELSKDPALMMLALAINHPETGLFSVGSVSGQSHDSNGYRDCGYIEFTLNSRTAIADATSYFPLFFHFDRFLKDSEFQLPTRFEWELEGATFTECDDSSGFTCTVFVNTSYAHSKAEADDAWSKSLDALGHYLRRVPPSRNDYLYPP